MAVKLLLAGWLLGMAGLVSHVYPLMAAGGALLAALAIWLIRSADAFDELARWSGGDPRRSPPRRLFAAVMLVVGLGWMIVGLVP